MKGLIIAMIIMSGSSFAFDELKDGDTLIISPDGERIERFLKTGDGSCKGSCAEVSFDMDALSAFFSNSKEGYYDYCADQIQNSKNDFEAVQAAYETKEISYEDYIDEMNTAIELRDFLVGDCTI